MRLLHCSWNNFSWTLITKGYCNVMNWSKNIKYCEFCMKILYCDCRKIAKKLLNALFVKFHLSIVWNKYLSSNQKHLISQNHFQLGNSHECYRLCKFEYLYSSFVYSQSDAALLTVQCLYLPRNKGLLVLLPKRNKRFAITFHEKQTVNLENQYHIDAK